MKKSGKQIRILALSAVTVLFITACGGQESKTEETTTTTTEETTSDMSAETSMDTAMAGGGMMAHMHQNMEEMQSMKANMSGDPDYDFALMMTHHHQGAIRMADEEIANGTDAKMKEMAQKTKTSNQADIQKLQAFAGKHTATKGDTATTMRMMQPMNRMMQQMHQQDMSNMNTDQNFATMMIHHHQMGNEMAKEFLKIGKTQEMKQLAQKTIDQQTKEIKELENWQQQNK